MGLLQDAYRRHLFFDKGRQLLPVYHAFVEYCVSRDLFINRPPSLMDSWSYQLYPRETDYNFGAERGTAWRAWTQRNPRTCSNQAAFSVAFWRLFEFFQIFELLKFFFKYVLCELFSHWPSGYSPFEAPDNRHTLSAFC